MDPKFAAIPTLQFPDELDIIEGISQFNDQIIIWELMVSKQAEAWTRKSIYLMVNIIKSALSLIKVVSDIRDDTW